MGPLSVLKKIPLDLAQAEMREKTKGKLIAFSYVQPTRGGQAIDIGCRDRYWSTKLAERGYAVTSIDLAPRDEKVIKVDIEQGLPFGDETFDVVWCSEVIEHVKNPKALLREMMRVCNKDGSLLITTPNSYFWLMRILGLFGITPNKVQNREHRQFFDLMSLRSILPAKHDILGFFPYLVLRRQIRRFIGALSPTFVVIINKNKDA